MIASTGTQGAPSAADTGFADRLRWYQHLTREALQRRLPPREPRRHLYDLVNASLENARGGLGPALCLATCGALGGRAEDAADSAAAIEMLRHAFLVHEDLECDGDSGAVRGPLHRMSGVPLALNTGDAMQALSMRIMRHNFARLPEPVAWRIVDEFDHMLLQALEGRAMEIGWAQRTAADPNEAEYLRTVLKSTCWSGFMHPCRIGALIARPELEDLEPFTEFGYYLGAAWRIETEIAELIRSRERRGDEPGNLDEAAPSLVMTHLLQQASSSDRARVLGLLQLPRHRRIVRDVDWLHDLFRRQGSVDLASARARELAAAAGETLARACGGSPVNTDRQFLDGCIQQVVDRLASS